MAIHASVGSEFLSLATFLIAAIHLLIYFNHKLFDDWDADEWNRFYNLMFTCVAFYFGEGVKEQENGNKLKRKHIKLNFGEEFLEWFDEQKELLFENHKPFRVVHFIFTGK